MRFSYSKLQDGHKCAKYYELKHLLGQDDGSERSSDMAFGKALHLGIQDLYEGGDGIQVFGLMWDTYNKQEMEYSRYGWDDLNILGASLIGIFRDEHMHKFTPMHLEKKIIGKIGQHDFSGVIDLVGEYKGLISVVDWKSAAYPYDAYKIRHNEQLYVYADMAEKEYGIKIEQAVYGVAIKDPKNPRWQFKVTPITRPKVQSVLDNIEKMCDHLSQTKHFIKNVNQCVIGKRVCPFFETCHPREVNNAEGESKE